MVGLAAYPAVLEPALGLSDQTRFWRFGYELLALLIAACAAVVLRSRDLPFDAAAPRSPPNLAIPVTARRRARWLALAFVPSSLLLGVTTYVTTDIAPLPLFWVIPLALYLLSFIFVFAKRPPLPHAAMVRFLPLAVTMAAISIALEGGAPWWLPLLVLLHTATLFLAAMVCHGELAHDRPEAAHLTEYYLWISVGGVLGGVFNALVAPALFSGIAEYPLALVLACLCRRVPAARDNPRERALDLVLPAATGALGVALLLGHRAVGLAREDATGFVSRIVVVATPFLVAHGFLARPRRHALAIGAALAASTLFTAVSGRTVLAARNFYGVVRVRHDEGGRFVELVHGNTVHGLQSLDPSQRLTPLGYYHRTGPLGAIMDAWSAGAPSPARVGVIGLGSGEMAAYARPGDAWTFYEINPAVIRVARDPRYFTFLTDRFPEGQHLTIVEGDARLRLGEAPPRAFDLLALDAFSSDAIPAHLLTGEAVALYLEKLEEHGLLVVHVSNRYLDLVPVLANLARDAGLVAVGWGDIDLHPEAIRSGKIPSRWVVLARRREDLGALASDARWIPLAPTQARVWSDDFSNLLGVYRW
jgi:spermidine synthase